MEPKTEQLTTTEQKPEETKVSKPKTEKQLEKEAQKNAKKEAALKKAADKAEKDAQKAEKPEKEGKKKKDTTTNLSKPQEEEKEMDLETAIKTKKDLSLMAEKYDPRAVEKYWYQWWKDNKFWNADAEKALASTWDKKFTMVLPPPNVTGYLHIGHALMITIEDTLSRWHRMNGRVVEWTPGTDHAGIGTQVQVEKFLLKTEGKTKRDYGRDVFLDKVLQWQKKHGSKILEQCGKMGASMDWDRYYYTFEEKLNKSVTEAFIRLFEKGLIYRANRLVNWCCKLQTALSDVECETQEIDGPTKIPIPNHKYPAEFGCIWSFAYQIKDSDDKIIVATTRPETMLGDVAVAVHPDDPRYKHLHGKEIVHPFIPDRKMRVITDSELVDMTFGTGAVKITPAHDPNDYKCGKKHNLEFINIFTDEGKLNENAGPYADMLRFDCRHKILKDLEAKGLFIGKEKNPMRLQFCSKSKDVIEPMLKPQWYVNCQEVAKDLIRIVKDKEMEILPEVFNQDWYRWLENIQDWCISRQIWWGHRCPVFLVSEKDKPKSKPDDETLWVAAKNQEEALEKASKKFNLAKENIILEQDEDVLDTWFSSALLPFSVYGWPDMDHADLKAFYPGHLLETGSDILFFWVARMCMMGIFLMNKPPFKTVFLHQIVRDEDGEKMSKSKGNVIDPLDVIDGATLEKIIEGIQQSALSEKEVAEAIDKKKKKFEKYKGIPECGADSLRFGLLAYTIQNRFINLDVEKIINWRLFGNKIWQSFRFATLKFPKDFKYQLSSLNHASLSLIDQWILHKLNVCMREMQKLMADYNFGQATIAFHQYWLYELCDVYLEAIKPVFLRQNYDTTPTTTVLFTALEHGLRLLHPIMPFITEELYQKLPEYAEKKLSVSITSYPAEVPEWSQNGAAVDDRVEYLMNIIKQIRALASSVNLPPSAKPDVYLVFLKGIDNTDQYKKLVLEENEVILTLSKAKQITILEKTEDVPKGCLAALANKNVEVFLSVNEFIKVEEEVARLQKKLEQNQKFIENQLKKMNIKDYDTKVPESVRIENKEKLDGLNLEKTKLEEALENVKKMA